MGDHASCHILFVEDEPIALELMTRSLSDQGHDVTGFSCPSKALEWFKKNSDSINILITDQSMPSLTGLELIEQSRAIRPNLPAVIVTGLGSLDPAMKKARDLHIIEKPYKRQELFDLILKLSGASL